MPNKNYISGRAFEYKVKKYFELKGYLVFRTAGSHGIADLIVIQNVDSNQPATLVQCKHHGKFSKNEMIKSIMIYEKYNADFIIAMMEKRKLVFKRIYYHCKDLKMYESGMI